MTITMNDSRLNSIKDITQFLQSTQEVFFKRTDRKQTYQWIEETLIKFNYMGCSKSQKSIIKQYLAKITRYSRAQITRLITQYVSSGCVQEIVYDRHSFTKLYSDEDIKFLAKTDELHDFPNGAALKKILSSMTQSDKAFKNIAQISVAHIYNLRRSTAYKRTTKKYNKTKPTQVNIGLRQKPQPNGQPGFIRVDTVHQGDSAAEKGVYHINTIDEVTQFEFIGSVAKITEEFLLPLLRKLINAYPFIILGFHADNGSEYINRFVVELLNKLLIQLTKSRPRHSNDNALVESKNGSVIRKWLGYGFIPPKFALDLNKFFFGCFNHYLNFHRPCAFATIITNSKGKAMKIYKQNDYLTPYEKLKSLLNARKYLKKGLSFKILDNIAYNKTNNQMAQLIQLERSKLFSKIFASS